MNISPVDGSNNLFTVKDVVSKELLHELSELNLMDVPWERQKKQEQKNRRCIIVEPNSVFDRINNHINSKKDIVGQSLGIEIAEIWGVFWLDLEGFSIGRHIDNPRVARVLQVYLTNNDSSPTIFFNADESTIVEKDTSQKYYYESKEVPEVRH